MRKDDQNFIRISGTVTTSPKIYPGGKRNEACFDILNKYGSRGGVKQNTFSVRWYSDLEKLSNLHEGDRVMVVGKAATIRGLNESSQVVLVTKDVIFY